MSNQGENSGQGKTITPEQAMANTRELLQRKQEDAQQARAAQPDQPGDPGFQSDQARVKAQELHEGEARLQGTHGSISTTDRHNQGRRDSR